MKMQVYLFFSRICKRSNSANSGDISKKGANCCLAGEKAIRASSELVLLSTNKEVFMAT